MSGPERPKRPWGRTNGGGFFDLHPPPPPNRCPQTGGPRASIAVLQRPRHRPHCLQAPPSASSQRYHRLKNGPWPSRGGGAKWPRRRRRSTAAFRLGGGVWGRRRCHFGHCMLLPLLLRTPPPNHAEPHRDDDDENLLKQCLHLLNNVPQTMLALLNDIRTHMHI